MEVKLIEKFYRIGLDNSRKVANFALSKLKQVITIKLITIMTKEINGNVYQLNQCTDDLHDWCQQASVGDYTHYYNQIVFKNEQGVYACYASDLTNIREI